MKRILALLAPTLLALPLLAATAAHADPIDYRSQCGLPQFVVVNIQRQLPIVVQMNNGGIFRPSRMWSAVVDRAGVLCSVAKAGDAWPGSRAIAIAKASTANDFSNSALSLSTANLYAATQPGGSLYGLNNSNPFNPADNLVTIGQGPGTGVGQTPGGIITFGGGLALYSGGQVIGALGVSGDSSCADHTIAYRMRHYAGYDTIPTGILPSDNIQYAPVGTAPTGFQQPHCGFGELDPGQILQ